jgi:lipopolysaccharide/colanic/teichoic acid biosynthesis glycosyltransferase
LALLLASPVLLACAAAIVLDDGGPVFFRQRRMGRGNQFFDIFKFRTMKADKADALGTRSTAKDDERVTRVGHFLCRTSLDELPQLINVLKGEMSSRAAGLPHLCCGQVDRAGLGPGHVSQQQTGPMAPR